MDILVDTHILLWQSGGSEKISIERRQILDDPNNHKFISVASIWEIAIKQNKGKLKIQKSIYDLIPDDTKIIGIELSHINQLQNLPFHHRDHFDRMIIAQARVENLSLMSNDKVFANYDVNLL